MSQEEKQPREPGQKPVTTSGGGKSVVRIPLMFKRQGQRGVERSSSEKQLAHTITSKRLALIVLLFLTAILGCKSVPSQRPNISETSERPIIAVTTERPGTIVTGEVPVITATPEGPTTGVHTRADGTFVVNGEAFFPIGMYHVSSYGSDEDRLAALRDMASAGFNLIHPSIDRYDTPFLDEAAALGVYVLAESSEEWAPVIDAHKDHRAIFGWDIADDSHLYFTPDEVQVRHDSAKARDPNHVTVIGMADPDKFGQYITISDAACVYSYPIPDRPLSTVNQVLSHPDLQGQSIIGVPQAFAWQNTRPPTPAELRNMTYQMLVNGVKGLLYYTYFDGGWNITDHPDLWTELGAMIPELRALSSVYTDGLRTKIDDTGAKDVIAAEWIHDLNSYIVVVNMSPRRTRDVSIALPSGMLEQPQSMFAGRPAGLTNVDGVLRGSIAPLEVHIYVIEPTTHGFLPLIMKSDAVG
jgi:hypothetical protein